MFSADNNLKDSTDKIPLKDNFFSVSYTKTHKLITALYMVTDVIDKEEPIRNKLRVLGTEIISDMHCVPVNASSKIAETVSFLNIASAMNFISEMNCTILKKEFLELKASIQQNIDMKPTWLAEFLLNPNSALEEDTFPKNSRISSMGYIKPDKRQESGARIGVQKGSTLMQALSDKTLARSVDGGALSDTLNTRKERRDSISDIIKLIGGSATIKDIKDKVSEIPEQHGQLASCGEKTLQRELVAMVRDGVLNKTGEKRWSRYQIRP